LAIHRRSYGKQDIRKKASVHSFPGLDETDQFFDRSEIVVVSVYSLTVTGNSVLLVPLQAVQKLFFSVSLDKEVESTGLIF
jgi:hypothetical protein